jgi:hypothetical protein
LNKDLIYYIYKKTIKKNKNLSKMSEKVVSIEEKEKDCNSIPSEIEMKEDMNMNKKKILSMKKIEFILLFTIIIFGLFFFGAWLLLSKKSNLKTNINDQLTQGLRKTDSFSNYEKQVLLITNYFSKTINSQNNIATDVLYNILLQIKTVNITILDAYDPDLDNKDISYLKNFDLVVLDLLDAGYGFYEMAKNFVRNLVQYLNEGGALFTGHDQFDATHQRFITQEAIDMLSVLGLIHQNGWGVGSGSTSYFEKSALKKSIFLINHALYGDSIPIAYTHQTYSRYNTSCETCNVIMKFVNNGGDIYEYLVTNRPNRIGRTVNIRAGHSSAFTEAEKKIFLSSILWLLYDI